VGIEVSQGHHALPGASQFALRVLWSPQHNAQPNFDGTLNAQLRRSQILRPHRVAASPWQPPRCAWRRRGARFASWFPRQLSAYHIKRKP